MKDIFAIVRRVTLLAALLGVAGQAAATSYYFSCTSGGKTYYVAIDENGSLTSTPTFSQYCIWTAVNSSGAERDLGTSAGDRHPLFAIDKSGTKRYLYYGYGTGGNNFRTKTSADESIYLRDGYLCSYYNLLGYWLSYESGSWKGRNIEGSRIRVTETKISSTKAEDKVYSIETPTITPSSLTITALNSAQTLTASATASVTKTPGYDYITMNGTTYYIRKDTYARSTSVPTAGSATGINVSYTWNKNTLPANASMSATTGATTNVTYNTAYTDADKTGLITLQATAVDGTTATSTTAAASVSVTLKKIPVFYYTASTAVAVADVATVSVTPTSGNVTGTSSSQTSASVDFTYKASIKSGKENLYEFAGWSTDGTAAGIISGSNVASFTYNSTITSTNSASPTAVTLTAMFTPLSRLTVKTTSGMGYVYSVGDSPYTGNPSSVTEDVTTCKDGNSHTMYMYAWPLQHTVDGETVDQFKFKGWSSTNSLSNIDGGTTAIGQTITVGSPEYKEMYAMFKRYFKFKVEGVSVSNGVVSTDGGTVVATFVGKSPAGTGSSDEMETEIETGTSSKVTTSFTATPLNGYQFKGWYSDESLTAFVNGANPYTPELQNDNTGTTQTLKLYAKFTLETPPTSISIGGDFEMEPGNTKDLTLTYTPNTAATHKYTKFVSSDPTVATVSPDHVEGNVYAFQVQSLKVGVTTITATAYGTDNTTPACSTSITVTVKDKLPNPVITVTPDPDDLNRALVTITPGTGSPSTLAIYYTTNGQDPTTASTLYSAPFYIPNLTTVKAIATSTAIGWMNSDIVQQGYSKQKAKRPIIDIDGNEVTFLSASEPDVTYYYTTDGSEPTTGHGTTWTTAAGPITDIASGSTIKVIATKADLGPSDVASALFTRLKVPTPEIQVAGNRVWFLDSETGVTYYYTTDGTTPTTSSTSNSGSEITVSGAATIKVFAVKDGYVNSEVASKDKIAANEVYLDFSSGNDSNDGRTASTAKKTWAGAYALLGFGPNATYLRGQWSANGLAVATHTAFNGDAVDTKYYNTVDNNIIYLVGDVSSDNLNSLMNYSAVNGPSSEQTMMNTIVGSGFFKPATISGKYATSHTDADGSKYARISMSPGTNYALKEDTRFEYVEFYGTSSSTTSETQFILCYYDLEMGKNIQVHNFLSTKNFSTYHHGYAQGVTNTAHILFYGGVVNDSRFTSGTKELQFDYYLPHPEGYEITIRSGYFSTISPGGKQWNSSINGVMGSPNTPVKCTMLVDIDRAWNDKHTSGVLLNGTAPDCDVAVLIAGTHEGSMYGDVDIIVKSGRIDRVVNGSFGAHNQITGYPCDSYFGRANILIDPREPSSAELTSYPTKNDLVVIRELYGGGLGRYKSTSGSAQAATNFYGQSTVTINGGTFSSAIYASGAGGCNGIGDDTHSTVDQYIPYWSSSAKTGVTYGTYANWKASANKLKVTCHNSSKAGDVTEIDLAKTSTKIEIHGGVFGSSSAPIDGIFGGGYGYVDKELIADGVTPHTQAGSILAAAGDLASSVLIDGKTEIYGNVYAAGRGTKYYYDYGRTTYTALALISGNTQLTIGGKVKVHGGVYGAGQGISTLANMARLYGNTTIKIQDRAEVSDGVYGGGQDGSMDGNVTLSLLGDCKIGTSTTAANVHGGGYGSTTNVNGNVTVNIGDSITDEPIVYGDVYGGSALGKVNASTSNTTTVTMNSGTVNGSIYGGGLGNSTTAADVNGNVQVNVYEGTVSKTSVLGSGGVYGCNNVNGTPKGTVKVDIYGTDPAPSPTEYALYSVYGGGNQSAYTGTPIVTIHDCDNSIEYVYGGGNAAEVAGTDVRIYGGDVIGNVFGGGNGSSEGWPSGTENPGANVTTNGTKVNIYGGTILSVFGGSNTKGLITGGTSVIVNAKQEEGAAYACKVNVDNVFGAGNKAPYTGDTDVQIINTSAGGLDGSVGNVFGGGNLAQMTGNSSVKVGAKNPVDTTYKVNITGNVFGGGNEANTAGNTNVSVENCATTIDGDVYGGANLANVTNSNVNIYGGTIDNVFGGGRGSTTTSSDLTNATTNIYGGKFGGIYGAGNIKSNITGVAFLMVDEKTSSEHACCDFEGANEIYGAGNQAAIDGSIIFGLGCIPGKIEELYGGAKNADLGSAGNPSNVVLSITSGQFGKVFGGNNLGGTIYGTVTVNVQHNGCDDIEIDELYGGGNLADYSAPTGNTNFPVVNLRTCDQKDNLGNPAIDWVNDGTSAHHCLKVGKVFGGGKGVNAPGDNRGKVIGNPHVNVYAGEVGTIYGGGNAADVEGETYVTVLDEAAGDNQDIYITGNIYGGGNEAAVTGGTGKGNTHVQIGPK